MIAYDQFEDSNVVDFTVEALIDQLHSYISEGKLSEAQEIAYQIKQLHKSTT
ncbi:MAG: hypothetical protein O3C19_04170 [Bacteroidetes bacterium]|nr:hypothetical protein [Bacteroidota bacterium]